MHVIQLYITLVLKCRNNANAEYPDWLSSMSTAEKGPISLERAIRSHSTKSSFAIAPSSFGHSEAKTLLNMGNPAHI